MRERLEQILKIICLALAVLLVVQLVKVVIHVNPLAGVVVPEMPSLPADTNAPVKVVANGPMKSGTNGPGTNVLNGTNISKTNVVAVLKDTNGVTSTTAKESASNAAPTQLATESPATNRISARKVITNNAVMELAATNSVMTNIEVSELSGTNVVVPNIAGQALGVTNIAGTNLVVMKTVGGTNVSGGDLAKAVNTNSVAAKKGGSGKKPPMGMPGMPGGFPGGMPGMKAASLPPDVQARVDRVTDSEIFGPVMRPMPMALLGIAGNVAFLRSPSGQTGLVKEGDSLGELKLLKIGLNRVLVEQDGQKKELMIFSGLGGESLLPKTTVTSDETTKH